jgi:hypothetical protein
MAQQQSRTIKALTTPRAAAFSRRAPQIVFANLGAAYGTAKAGVGIASMGIMHPSQVRLAVSAPRVFTTTPSSTRAISTHPLLFCSVVRR